MSDAVDSDTDSKDILNRAVPPSNMISKPIPGRPIARLYCKNRFEYLITKTRVLVGRSGGDVKANCLEVDISIDSCSLYISRRHFDIFTTDCIKFFVSVYSKNGLFVNGLFLRRGSAAFQLKNQSRLRFPKTDLKILFQIFEREIQPEIEASSPNNNHDLPIPKEENGRGDADQIEDKLPTTLQTYNSMYQQQLQQQISQQQQQQQQQPLISPMNSPDKNIDPFSVNAINSTSKLEREVFKQQQLTQQQMQQQQQQIPPLNNNSNPNSATKKRKFSEIPETMASNHQQLSQDWGSRGDYSDGRKPPFSYSQLIAQAIFSTPDHMLCLNDIYMFITKTYPFYRPEEKGWQNSIRHNLSLSKSFVRMPRANDEGKGSLWTIQYNDKQNMMKTAYRPRGARDKYNHHHHQSSSANKLPRMLTESMSSVGDSEDSQDMYQNEDEEAANSIAMPGQVAPEGFTFAGGDQFGESDSDQLGKPAQAAILQSSFANPMQIFMQPDRRGLMNQQQQQQPQQLNLAQLQRANLSGSGSVQVVRLTVNPNNNDPNNGGNSNFVGAYQQKGDQLEATTTPTWQQQQPQQIFIQQQQQQQPQQIRIQQQQGAGSGQRIIILRPAQQQQNSTDSTLLPTNSTTQATLLQQQPKKIILASGSNLSMLNGVNDNNQQQQQRIIFSQQQQQIATNQQQIIQQQQQQDNVDELNAQVLQDSGLNEEPQQHLQQQPLQFEMLTFEQQQQILLELQKQQQQQENDDLLSEQNSNIDEQLQQQQEENMEHEEGGDHAVDQQQSNNVDDVEEKPNNVDEQNQHSNADDGATFEQQIQQQQQQDDDVDDGDKTDV